jgi:hypothetical protein
MSKFYVVRQIKVGVLRVCLGVQLFLYYILLLFIIFKIMNIQKDLFFKIMFRWFRELETKLKKN